MGGGGAGGSRAGSGKTGKAALLCMQSAVAAGAGEAARFRGSLGWRGPGDWEWGTGWALQSPGLRATQPGLEVAPYPLSGFGLPQPQCPHLKRGWHATLLRECE